MKTAEEWLEFFDARPEPETLKKFVKAVRDEALNEAWKLVDDARQNATYYVDREFRKATDRIRELKGNE